MSAPRYQMDYADYSAPSLAAPAALAQQHLLPAHMVPAHLAPAPAGGFYPSYPSYMADLSQAYAAAPAVITGLPAPPAMADLALAAGLPQPDSPGSAMMPMLGYQSVGLGLAAPAPATPSPHSHSLNTSPVSNTASNPASTPLSLVATPNFLPPHIQGHQPLLHQLPPPLSPATLAGHAGAPTTPMQPGPRKRPSMSRTRTGCWSCRLRRKKCSEEKPNCKVCLRLNIQCYQYSPQKPDFIEYKETGKKLLAQFRRQIRSRNRNKPRMRRTEGARDDTYSNDGGSSSSGAGVGGAGGAGAEPGHGHGHGRAMAHDGFEGEPPSLMGQPDDGINALDLLLGRKRGEKIDELPGWLDVPVPSFEFAASSVQTLPCIQDLLRSPDEHEMPISLRKCSLNELCHLVVYFRFAMRLQFVVPCVVEQPVDFKLEVFNGLLQNVKLLLPFYASLSVAYIRGASPHMLGRSPLTADLGGGEPPPAQRTPAWHAEHRLAQFAGSLVKDAARVTEFYSSVVERILAIGWHTITYKRFSGLGLDRCQAELDMMLDVIGRFNLLRRDDRDMTLLMRTYVAFAVWLDVLSCAVNGKRSALYCVYKDLYLVYAGHGSQNYVRANDLFETSFCTGCPFPVLLMIAQITDLAIEHKTLAQQLPTTAMIMRAQGISTNLNTIQLKPDAPAILRTLATMYLCATRVYLATVTTLNSGVDDQINEFFDAGVSKFLTLSPAVQMATGYRSPTASPVGAHAAAGLRSADSSPAGSNGRSDADDEDDDDDADDDDADDDDYADDGAPAGIALTYGMAGGLDGGMHGGMHGGLGGGMGFGGDMAMGGMGGMSMADMSMASMGMASMPAMTPTAAMDAIDSMGELGQADMLPPVPIEEEDFETQYLSQLRGQELERVVMWPCVIVGTVATKDKHRRALMQLLKKAVGIPALAPGLDSVRATLRAAWNGEDWRDVVARNGYDVVF
ncbi:uncharacterized protein V1510DRAFT_401405 [Dipodascopsis tothii]|uniref:uncharacterized protein n=1 Tax=Dipodascopsis tothii TaxID=44089 RepID=UPI0034D0207A